MRIDLHTFLDSVADFVVTGGLALVLLVGAVFAGEALGRVLGRRTW